MNRKSIALALALTAATVAGVVTYVRSRPPPDTRGREVQALLDSAHQAYLVLPMARWDAPDSPPGNQVVERAIASLHETVAPDAAPDYTAAREDLRGELREFLDAGVVRRDIEAYTAWRRSRGYTFRTMDDMDKSWWVRKDWERDLGEPCPDDLDTPTAFERHWSAWADRAPEGSVPVAIAQTPEGLECAVGFVTSLDGESRPQLLGALGQAGWTGAQGGTARTWWTHPRNASNLLVSHRRILCAEVGMILEYANGSRFPLATTWVHDPEEHGWRLEHVCVYNWDTDRPVRSMEY